MKIIPTYVPAAALIIGRVGFNFNEAVYLAEPSMLKSYSNYMAAAEFQYNIIEGKFKRTKESQLTI